MAAIMEGTRFSYAVAESTSVLRTFLMGNHPGTIFIQIKGSPQHKVGDTVTYVNPNNNVIFTGKVWYIYKGSSKEHGTVHNLYVKHPEANSIGVNSGGVLYRGSAVPVASGSGTGSAADILHQQEENDVIVNENGDIIGGGGAVTENGEPLVEPTMASVMPAGLDVKKVGIGLGVLVLAYFLLKGKAKK
jgi:hypothetical protein